MKGAVMRELLVRFGRDARGQTAMEYAMIGTLISIVAIAAITNIGTSTFTMTNSILAGFR
jgi:Flp pilus assembly pilin Flp